MTDSEWQPLTRARVVLLLGVFAASGLVPTVLDSDAPAIDSAIAYLQVMGFALLVSFTVFNTPAVRRVVDRLASQTELRRDYRAAAAALGVVGASILIRVASDGGAPVIFGGFFGACPPLMYLIVPKR